MDNNAADDAAARKRQRDSQGDSQKDGQDAQVDPKRSRVECDAGEGEDEGALAGLDLTDDDLDLEGGDSEDDNDSTDRREARGRTDEELKRALEDQERADAEQERAQDFVWCPSCKTEKLFLRAGNLQACPGCGASGAPLRMNRRDGYARDGFVVDSDEDDSVADEDSDAAWELGSAVSSADEGDGDADADAGEDDDEDDLSIDLDFLDDDAPDDTGDTYEETSAPVRSRCPRTRARRAAKASAGRSVAPPDAADRVQDGSAEDSRAN